VHELAAAGSFATAEPITLNRRLRTAFGRADREIFGEPFRRFLEADTITAVVTGTISRSTTGFLLHVRLHDTRGEVRVENVYPLPDDDALPFTVRSAVQKITGHFLGEGRFTPETVVHPGIARRLPTVGTYRRFLEARRVMDRGLSTERLLQSILRTDPAFLRARIFLTFELLDEGRTAEAERIYPLLLKAEQRADLFEQAMISAAGARLTGNDAAYDAALRRAMQYSVNDDVLCFHGAQSAVRNEDYGRALSLLRPSLRYRRPCAAVYTLAAYCALARGDSAEAKRITLSNWELCRSDPDASALRAVFAYTEGFNDSATAWEQRFVASFTRRKQSLDSAYDRLAEYYRLTGRADRAVEWARKAVAAAPAQPARLCRLAHALAAAGAMDEAEDTLAQCIARFPLYAPARYDIGRLYESTGRFSEAAAAYDSMLAIDTLSFRALDARRRRAALPSP
ncbi:MAG: tetratricopeptide repeat protein, partial [Bacteroidota bacterium]|nr:tetratricopeptide repeat protein [Bacteroidota bacterium]